MVTVPGVVTEVIGINSKVIDNLYVIRGVDIMLVREMDDFCLQLKIIFASADKIRYGGELTKQVVLVICGKVKIADY